MRRLSAISLFLIILFSIKGQDWGDADVAYMIYDIDSSRVVSASHADTKMTPASLIKLVTTASALEMMGAGHRIMTPVTTDGTVDAAGVLNGNLYVRGALDPTVESAYFPDVHFFMPLIDSLKAAGIKSINGDIIVDGSIVKSVSLSDKWVFEDLATYYGVACYGISVYDNVQKLKMKTGEVGVGVTFSFDYPECQPRVIDHIDVLNKTENGVRLYAMPFGNEVLVEGKLRRKSSWSEPLAITDPPLFFALRLKSLFQEGGITVSGGAVVGKSAGITTLYAYYSPLLFNIVRETNYRSNNHFSQHLFMLLGSKVTDKSAVSADAVRTVRSIWKNRGVDLSTADFYDGNGLSPFNAVSTHRVIDLLNYMWRSDNGYYFFYSLPECGKDGTVKKFFAGSPMYIRAKTGSMGGVQNLAGYIVSKGRCYSFCIMVNHFSGSRQQIRNLIEQTITTGIANYENSL